MTNLRDAFLLRNSVIPSNSTVETRIRYNPDCQRDLACSS